jgi:hypothetical protein
VSFFAPLEMTARSAEVNRRVMKLLKEARIPVILMDRRPEQSAAGERDGSRMLSHAPTIAWPDS